MGFVSVINTNISGLIGLNNLRLTNLGLKTSLERLSSGLRINKAADDPSGRRMYDILRRHQEQPRARSPRRIMPLTVRPGVARVIAFQDGRRLTRPGHERPRNMRNAPIV